jgi:cysteine desulfurase
MAASFDNGKTHLIVSAIEHHAVLAQAESLEEHGARVTRVPVDAHGCVDPDGVSAAITPRTSLISVMHANNEVGSVQAVGMIADSAHERGVLMHTDAVQSFGKIGLDLREIPVDLVSVTAHKLYGPKGIGALVIRKGTPFRPQMIGGAQEGNRRAGTENVPLAVGFAKACALAIERRVQDERIQDGLREQLRSEVLRRFPDALVNGHPTARLPHILSISFPWERYRLDGETLIAGMDLRGIAVTSGSACTSGTLQASHVLLAMGRDERTARATVRFSVGRGTTEDDIRYAAEALEEVVRTAGSSQ